MNITYARIELRNCYLVIRNIDSNIRCPYWITGTEVTKCLK